VFRQHIGCHIEVLVFAVEQQHVGEGFRGERRVAEKMVELFEAILRVFFHVHESLVHKGDRVKLVFASWRHVD